MNDGTMAIFPTKAAEVNDPQGRSRAVRAVRTVASASRDATDCAVLLGILGLDPTDGKHGGVAS
jgi:hypothetical protein